MLRIAICDDERHFLDVERQYVEKHLTMNNVVYEIGCFVSGVSFIGSLEKDKDYDLVLLDVEMPADNGIDVAKKILEINPSIRVAFVSAYANYAISGYHVKAIRFILKNAMLETYIGECLDHVLSESEYDNRKVTFEFTLGKRELCIDDILYLDADRNYVHFILNDKMDKGIYKVRGSLKDITDYMNKYHFAAVSYQRSVNLKYVKSVVKQVAIMDNGDRIAIAQRKYKDFRKAFTLYRGTKL